MGPELIAAAAAAAPTVAPLTAAAIPAAAAAAPAIAAPALSALAPAAAMPAMEAVGAAALPELGMSAGMSAAEIGGGMGSDVLMGGAGADAFGAPIAAQAAPIEVTTQTMAPGVDLTAAQAAQAPFNPGTVMDAAAYNPGTVMDAAAAQPAGQPSFMDAMQQQLIKSAPGLALSGAGTALNYNAISAAQEQEEREAKESAREVARQQEAMGGLINKFGQDNLSAEGYEKNRAGSETDLLKFFQSVVTPEAFGGTTGNMSSDYADKLASATLKSAQGASDIAKKNAALLSHSGASLQSASAASRLNAEVAPHLTAMNAALGRTTPTPDARKLLVGSAAQALGGGLAGRA